MVNQKIGSEIFKNSPFLDSESIWSVRVILLTNEGLKVLFAE